MARMIAPFRTGDTFTIPTVTTYDEHIAGDTSCECEPKHCVACGGLVHRDFLAPYMGDTENGYETELYCDRCGESYRLDSSFDTWDW